MTIDDSLGLGINISVGDDFCRVVDGKVRI